MTYRNCLAGVVISILSVAVRHTRLRRSPTPGGMD